MKTFVRPETIDNAFENKKAFTKFIADYTNYIEFMFISSCYDENFELTFEEFINKSGQLADKQ